MYKKIFKTIISILSITMVSSVFAQGLIRHELQQVLNLSLQTDLVNIIVDFSDKVDLNKHRHQGKKNRVNLIQDAKNKSHISQQQLIQYLASRNITEYKKLWLINALAVTVEAYMVPEITSLVGVSHIRFDKTITIDIVTTSTTGTQEWNIDQVNAPSLWDLGFTGQGIVVGILGTGVDVKHHDLASRYRGGTNSWFDPYYGSTTPYDYNGHGTGVMGIILGGNASGSYIGMAPGAKWIAAKIFDDTGKVVASNLHAAFQWMLDPDGNPATRDEVDIVNNSWNFTSSIDSCLNEYQNDIIALNNVGIAVVFSSGNSEPKAGSINGSSLSPANNINTISVGAVDESMSIQSYSGRGPSACIKSGIYPKIVAPGAGIFTASKTLNETNPNPYSFQTGTSFAAPHITGALALLQSAFKKAAKKKPLAEIEKAIRLSVVDLGKTGDDTIFGWGFLNVYGAYQSLLANNALITFQPDANTDSKAVNKNSPATKINVLDNDTADNKLVSTNVIDPKTVIANDPSNGSVSVDAITGMVSYKPTPGYLGIDSFTYTVSDTEGNVSNLGRVNIIVNEEPVVVAAAGKSKSAGCTLQKDSRFDPVITLLIMLSLFYWVRKKSLKKTQLKNLLKIQ